MVARRPRIVIIGAGMAGLTAANKLYTSAPSPDLFDLSVVEGGVRIGGRINTSEFNGDRIEMGATWIHGIGGSPIHKIAQQIHSLHSETPWECMDDGSAATTAIAEGRFLLEPSIVDPVTNLFKSLMDYSQGKKKKKGTGIENLASSCSSASVGSFLRKGLEAYFAGGGGGGSAMEEGYYGNWSRRELEEAVFAMHENSQRTYTSAGDLTSLDYRAESEYVMFPGEEITIAKGYLSIIEHLASVLPPGVIQLGKKVTMIEWQPLPLKEKSPLMPVKLHFSDGSVISADHVIVTVSLGVLKAAVSGGDYGDSGAGGGLFCPPLPPFKAEAISRLGFGVVNKLFVKMSEPTTKKTGFPFLEMVFHSAQSESRHKKIPWWMRRTATLFPIYNDSRVLLSWFAGEEAMALESLSDQEIVDGVTTTVSSFLPPHNSSNKLCNGVGVNSEVKFSSVLRTKWGSDPLFLGSYSYVAVGSSGDDLDAMAEPLPKETSSSSSSFPLQILFAGEATHRTHYSTTHGAYCSGLREANRLLQHYHLN